MKQIDDTLRELLPGIDTLEGKDITDHLSSSERDGWQYFSWDDVVVLGVGPLHVEHVTDEETGQLRLEITRPIKRYNTFRVAGFDEEA